MGSSKNSRHGTLWFLLGSSRLPNTTDKGDSEIMVSTSKDKDYCVCNACKSRRYGAVAVLLNLAIAVGVWTTLIVS